MSTYCLVKHRIEVLGPDSPGDQDRYPDRYMVNGTVTFTPNINNADVFVIKDEFGFKTVPALPITADIVDGELIHEGQAGVYLFAGGENANPSNLSYTATYRGLVANGVPITIRDVTFEAIQNGEIDLSTAQPVAGTPARGITRGAPGDTPYIGDNGNWWIGFKDTGVSVQGPAGLDGGPLVFRETAPNSGLWEITTGVTE